MGITANGLPYPVPTDPIADGADAIRALAEALDPRIKSSPGVVLTATGISIGSSAANDINWNGEISDPDNWHAANAVDVVVPAGKGGRYTVSATLILNGGLLGTLAAMSAMINGTTMYSLPLESAWFGGTLTFVRTLAAGDTIKFQVYQNSGAARGVTGRLEIV